MLRNPVHLVLLCCAVLVAPEARAQALRTTGEVPDGLGTSDWSTIRQAYEAGRHAAHPVEGGYRANNPGQRWQTRFDGHGFTTRPDGGGWTWGLELKSYGFAGEERAGRQGVKGSSSSWIGCGRGSK